MAPYLSVSDITTYQKLMSVVSRLENMPQDTSTSTFQPKRDFGKKAESKAVWAPKAVEKKVLNVDTSDDEDDKDKAKNNKQSKPAAGGSSNARPQRTLAELKGKPSSFRKDKVKKILKQAMKEGIQLPECKRPADMAKSDDPNFYTKADKVGKSKAKMRVELDKSAEEESNDKPIRLFILS